MKHSKKFKLGFLINPIAGIGGKTGLKGSDGLKTIRKAFSMGAKKESESRAEEATLQLKFLKDKFYLITCAGVMGQETFKRMGIIADKIIDVNLKNTTRKDTLIAAKKMKEEKVDLILFCGGDGTASDIFFVINSEIPILGIPAGVKMHSSVFGNSPNAVGSIVSRLIKNQLKKFETNSGLIMDLDEDLRRRDKIKTKLIGYAYVPNDNFLIQNPKINNQFNDENAISGIAEYLEKQIIEDATYVVGPGLTTYKFLEKLGISGTILGVDVLKGKNLVKRDVNSRQLDSLTKGGQLFIISGIIGGQGFLFGRANQQITADIIRRTEKKNLIVIASAKKIFSLPFQRLLIETGDKKLDRELSGYIKVQTDKKLFHMIKVEPA